MATDPRNHHIVTAGYLRQFAHKGKSKVTVHRAGEEPSDQGVRAVGYVRDFWASPELAVHVEEKFGKAEDAALKVISKIDARWPLTAEDRTHVSLLLAVHIVRSPAFGGAMRQIGAKANREVVAEGAVTYDLDEKQSRELEAEFGKERYHVEALLRQLPRITSFLNSMHWTLVEFDADWVITSDQPVVLLPYLPVPHTPASAVPMQLGLAATLEGWFTLNPRTLLLLSWQGGADARVGGEHRHACSVNCALRAQTLLEWFSRPGSRPPFLSPPILQPEISRISLELLHGYSVALAAESERRKRAEQIVMRMVQDQTPAKELHWVIPAA